jgi:hypothetical protein
VEELKEHWASIRERWGAKYPAAIKCLNKAWRDTNTLWPQDVRVGATLMRATNNNVESFNYVRCETSSSGFLGRVASQTPQPRQPADCNSWQHGGRMCCWASTGWAP